MPGEGASVSLVVPLQDEASTVMELLESVARLSRPPDDLIFVDAGSRDETAQMVAAFQARFPIKLVGAKRLYPGEARNVGVSASQRDWIAFTDGGIRLETQWLERLLARAGADVDAVYGSYAPVCDSLWTEASAIAYVAPRSAWGGRGPFIASMLVRRDAFQRVGGFPDYRAAEDLVFLERLAALGCRVAYAPDAVVNWRLAATPRATYRRFALYSHHNLAAGRGHTWHAGIARLYAALGFLVGLVGFFSVQSAIVVLALFFPARAARAAWRCRHDLPFNTLKPSRTLCAAAVLAVTDAATLAGTVRWLKQPTPSRG